MVGVNDLNDPMAVFAAGAFFMFGFRLMLQMFMGAFRYWRLLFMGE